MKLSLFLTAVAGLAFVSCDRHTWEPEDGKPGVRQQYEHHGDDGHDGHGDEHGEHHDGAASGGHGAEENHHEDHAAEGHGSHEEGGHGTH